MRKLVSFLLMSVLVFNSSSLTFANGLANEITTDSENLVEVVIFDDGTTQVVAMVPEDQVDNYLERSDSSIQTEAKEILATKNNYQKTRVYPDGKIVSQTDIGKAQLKAIVDKNAGSGTFANLISNPFTDATVAAIIKAAGYSNVVAFTVGLTSWSTSYIINKNNAWWNESYIMVLEGSIRCVRLTIIQNTTSTYPAAYRIIERVK